MSYHDLSDCSLTADERREEATRIVSMIHTDWSRMTQAERFFFSLKWKIKQNQYQ